MKGSTIFVDGSNLVRCEAWLRLMNVQRSGLDLAFEQVRLVDYLASWMARDPDTKSLRLYYDGAGPFGEGSRARAPGFVVIGTGRRSADALIERHLRTHTEGISERLWVVTSDRVLQSSVHSYAERLINSDQFVNEISSSQQGSASRRSNEVSVRSDLSSRVDAETLAKLERLRRGL